MSTFDPNSFLDLQITGSNDTRIIPIPIGEYQAVTGEVEIKTWQGKEDPSKSGLKLVVPLEIHDDAVAQITGRDKNVIRYEAMLDLMPDGKSLDLGKGKNVQLGRLREALSMNDPNVVFSPRQIPGRVLKVKVVHGIWKNEPIAECGGVTKAN